MSDIDEQEIKRRFESISQFEQGSEVAARDVEQVRRRLIRHMSGQQPGEQKIWRIIMKSRITKITAAAVIMIAALLAIYNIGPSSVALADVLAKVEQAKAYIPHGECPSAFFCKIAGMPKISHTQFPWYFFCPIEAT